MIVGAGDVAVAAKAAEATELADALGVAAEASKWIRAVVRAPRVEEARLLRARAFERRVG